MTGFRLPGIQDAIALVRETVSETADAFRAHLSRSVGISYAQSRAMLRPIYSCELTLRAALQRCARMPNIRNAQLNAEVIELVHSGIRGRKYLCHRLPPKRFRIRRDLSIPLPCRFYIVEGGQVLIPWLQPRKRYRLSNLQLGFMAAVFRHEYIVDDFEDADVEMIDTCVPEGGTSRQLRLLRFADVPYVEYTELEAAMQRLADAYDILVREGFERAQRRPKPKHDDGQQDLLK